MGYIDWAASGTTYLAAKIGRNASVLNRTDSHQGPVTDHRLRCYKRGTLAPDDDRSMIIGP